jgi:hypothetical protein
LSGILRIEYICGSDHSLIKNTPYPRDADLRNG